MSFGSNTSGAAQTKDYFLGRGKVYLSKLDPITNLPLLWRPVGNSTTFKLSVKTTKVQHYNSQSALKKADNEVATQQDVNVSFDADELSAENLAQFYSGGLISYTNPAIAGFTNATAVLNANAIANGWYDIQTTAGARAYDLLAGKETISVTAPGTVAALVVGTDYVMDYALGRFQLLASGLTKVNTGGAGIISVVMAADASASTLTRVGGSTQAPVRVALKLIPLNAQSPADRAELQIHSTMLTGNGDLGLIDDKYSVMSFEGLCGANTQVDPNSPYFTLTDIVAPRS